MRLLFTAFLCCVSFSLQSQCIEGNCENGMGKFKFEDGSVYQGKFRNFSPHSINANAKIFYSNGDIYSGKFRDGQRFGYAYLTFKNGDIFKGYFVNDLKNGEGSIEFSNGNILNGFFKDDVIDSTKTSSIKFKSGENYSGGVVNNLPHGNGQYVFADRTKYKAVFKNGLPTGEVTATYPNSSKYTFTYCKECGFRPNKSTNSSLFSDWQLCMLENNLTIEFEGCDFLNIGTDIFDGGYDVDMPDIRVHRHFRYGNYDDLLQIRLVYTEEILALRIRTQGITPGKINEGDKLILILDNGTKIELQCDINGSYREVEQIMSNQYRTWLIHGYSNTAYYTLNKEQVDLLSESELSSLKLFKEGHDIILKEFKSKFEDELTEFKEQAVCMQLALHGKNIEEINRRNSNNSDWLGNGSGLIISQSGHIVTNFHVIEDVTEIEVEFIIDDEVQAYNAEVIQSDKVNDLAIIKIVDVNFDGLEALPYNFKTRSSDVGTKVYAYGYPMALSIMGKEIKVTDGIISSKSGFDGDITTYQITAPIQRGNSGGPLFDEDGNFIGINSSGLKKDMADNVAYTIKSSYVFNLIDVLPKSIQLPSNSILESLPLTEQIKLITKCVVLVKVK